MNRRHLLGAAAAALAAPSLISPARAQGNWPSQPIRLVVPFAAGGPTDIPARLFAERIGANMSQRIVVENRTGAGVLVGTEAVAKANDGHTFLYTTVAHAVLRALFQRLPFDPEADFVPVALVGVIPMLVTVGRNSPIRDMAGLQAALKADPGGMTYASSGNGGALHLATELMLRSMDARALHVPYRGTAAAMPDVLNGTIPLIVDVATSALSYAQSGETRALAVMDRTRLPQLPNVPTTAEAGFPGLEAYTWHMVMAPKGTPANVVQTVNRAFMQVAAEAAVQQRLSDLAMRLVTDSTPDTAAAWLREETQKWSAVVREANITIN
ncbi:MULTISPECIES: Bug family tripartite tricarboxylate transporter substrate binding protein [Roseomonadaceae]|uniref:Tripartite tricarboxylate transporter substrate binding protein n=1 Tax=Falsiroseomonas oleicola TaxID=2801474 RepID=A0ABS6H8U4_9PROT|nr:tripartite tricarboxylate transporter substrate-binding protein [Roseomonas oleicola]MBU8545132.1 tripartite tricarboxylate transporter substrate binding protein [Roseomonas oleicola]